MKRPAALALPLITVALLALAAPLAAQNFSGLDDPLVADRPDFTESASTIPPGHFQVESGATLYRVDDEESETLGELLVRIGAGERWEGRIGVGSYVGIDPGTPGSDRITGYADPSVGIKVRFNEDDPALLPPGRPVMALLLSTTVPVGDDELTADEWVPGAKLALAWTLTDRFSLGSNVNYTYAVDGGERFHQFAGTLTGGVTLTDRLGAYLEYFGFSEEVPDGSTTHYIDGGLTFGVSNDLRLDVRAGFGLNDPSPDWFAGVGAVVRF
jgi:hypothetical protein